MKKQQQILILIHLNFALSIPCGMPTKSSPSRCYLWKQEVTEETEFSNSSTSWPTAITERQTTVTAFRNAVIINIPVENVPLITVFWGESQTLYTLSVTQYQNHQQWLERPWWKTKCERASVCAVTKNNSALLKSSTTGQSYYAFVGETDCVFHSKQLADKHIFGVTSQFRDGG